ncbi:hypothetical protein [Actinokineospora diospyrosa]|uniref:Uncharacterized protein n=1 Tax=Actinokineospora diospyrosa TaxID=103728 RepID=A0ABT1IDY8_9PSEU|nr:hypothetical protein [Actinokineospora diospyrosa]MCP2270824.1 hypothetical protein [Actinokineospora diospyrosa]
MHEAAPLLISSTEDGLTAPDSATPGQRSFRSETTAAGVGWVGLARLADGVTWDRFRRDLQAVVSDEQERIVKGMAALDGDAVLLGGAVIHPGRPGEFTAELVAGQHVLFDYPDTASDNPAPRYRSLTVEGSTQDSPVPDAAGTVRAVLTPDGPVFEVLGTPTAGQPLAFDNAMPRPYLAEAVVFPVADEVGAEELAEFFNAFVDGSPEWPPNPPFDLGLGCGTLPLSAGGRSVHRLAAGAGRHVVVNWLKDPTDGVRMAKRGQYRVIELG